MKWRMLVVLSIAELLGMALWFSATAVTPALVAEWKLEDAGMAWLTTLPIISIFHTIANTREDRLFLVGLVVIGYIYI